MDVLSRDLQVMDASAISLARENRIPIIVFDIHKPGAFAATMRGRGHLHDHQGRGLIMTADLNELEKRMHGAMDALKKELGGLRTGRASVSLLDPVMVEAYGQRMPLNQVGTVSAPEPRLLTVSVWDKGLVTPTAKAIREAGLGLNPSPDGQLVRVPIPELTDGAPQRTRQGRAQVRRAGPGGRAQRAPRRHGIAQEGREGPQDLARTSTARSPTRCRS